MSDRPNYGMSDHVRDLLVDRNPDISLTISWPVMEPTPPIVHLVREAIARDEPIALYVGLGDARQFRILDVSQPISGTEQSLTVRLRDVKSS